MKRRGVETVRRMCRGIIHSNQVVSFSLPISLLIPFRELYLAFSLSLLSSTSLAITTNNSKTVLMATYRIPRESHSRR